MGVEAVIAGYSGEDGAVAQEGSQVDAQEEPEVQELQLACVCKCQQEELCARVSSAAGFPFSIPFLPAHFCCLQESLPGALFLSPCLCPASAHTPHPICCLLSSVLNPLSVCRC